MHVMALFTTYSKTVCIPRWFNQIRCHNNYKQGYYTKVVLFNPNIEGNIIKTINKLCKDLKKTTKACIYGVFYKNVSNTR